MRPTVLSNANANASAGVGGGGGGSVAGNTTNGINIPIHHEPAGGYYADPNAAAYGSPRQQQQTPQQQQQAYHHPHQQQAPTVGQQQQQIPQHFQGFGFEPDMDMDMDMDMFPRSRLGRMHHDPFGSFGNSPDFGFPQFNSLGRRRAADHMGRDDDFFNRLPSEFRQYIPDGFGHSRRGESATLPRQHSAQHSQQVPVQGGSGGGVAPTAYYQSYVPASPPNGGPQSPSKKLCDAAIQTEDPAMRTSGDEVDSAAPQQHGDSLKQHGLRNTVDMGVKSALESEHEARAHSAPPHEQQQQQQVPVNGGKRPTPPPQAGQSQFGTQTSPHVQTGAQQPQLHKAYYAPQHQPHPQQRQQTPPPPQTPGGSYVRTIPIFVEGRSEPIINAHKEIPNQNAAPAQSQATASATARAHVPPQHQQPQYHQQQQQHHQPQQQQQHRPTPINTQQQPQQQGATQQPAGVPPQTPHTLDSISKIQDIQRDVLDLMGKVEKFTGTRQDKEYAYLDEMLTRNLLKLDTIDTNGKDSIRLARKEAIKCIQASINVLEAKANENTKAAEQSAEDGAAPQEATEAAGEPEATKEAVTRKSASREKVESAVEAPAAKANESEPEPADAKQIQAPIPLPPPEGMQVNEVTTAGSEAKSAETNIQNSESAGEVKVAEEAASGAVGEGATTEVSSMDAAESSK
ncbi:BAG domain-containing protein Samui isoform X2 [Rhagoletis pomonella]|uniref:BAG domain-containing protein Samui isoform X2 n=1 Tax=Rhagoletis pomonella TaxID=28610 RepID=UPI00177B5CE9|nr:BAG domain-containing protein Samui isoform X2 [Rhagoletis pomonella]